MHRGVSHGRDVGDVGRGLRAVAWERSAGQVVQIVLTVVVLLVLPSPVRSAMPLVALAAALAVAGVVLVGRARPGRGASRWARIRRAAAGDIRDGLLARQGVAGHRARVGARRRRLTPPPSWSPRAPPAPPRRCADAAAGAARAARDGAARASPAGGRARASTAWVFAAAGLGAAQGVATAVVYGVMAARRQPAGRRRARASHGCAARAHAGAARSRRGRGGCRRSRGRTEPPMPDRPYTLLSCGMSIDGYLGSATPQRLALSNDADFDRVDAVRAACDAILVGAATVRNDNPRLLVRSQTRRDAADGPRAGAVADEGHRDRAGGARRVLPTSSPPATPRSSSTARARAWPTRARASGRWPPWSTAASPSRCAGSARTSAPAACERLMVEGGGKVHTQFLDRQPRRRAAAGRRAVLRRRLAGAAVRERRPLPVEPGPARDARRGPPDRRRGAAALRALAAVPDRLTRGDRCRCHCPPRRSAPR